MTLKEQISNYISRGKIDKAFEVLKSLTLNDKNAYNQVLKIQGNYSRANRNFNQGQLSQANYDVEIAKVQSAIFDLIDDEDIKEPFVFPIPHPKPSNIIRNIIPITSALIVSIFTVYNIFIFRKNNKQNDIVVTNPSPIQDTFKTVTEGAKPIVSETTLPEKSITSSFCKPCTNNGNERFYLFVSTTPYIDGAEKLVQKLKRNNFLNANIHPVQGQFMVYADICSDKKSAEILQKCLKTHTEIDRSFKGTQYLPYLPKYISNNLNALKSANSDSTNGKVLSSYDIKSVKIDTSKPKSLQYRSKSVKGDTQKTQNKKNKPIDDGFGG